MAWAFSPRGVLEKRERMGDYVVLGELALDGRVKGIKGALPSAILARSRSLAGVVLPRENAAEASVIGDGIAVLGVETLREAFEFFEELRAIESHPLDSARCSPPPAAMPSISARSRARSRPSARSRSPPPAAITS